MTWKMTKEKSRLTEIKTYVSKNIRIVITDRNKTMNPIMGLKGYSTKIRSYVIYIDGKENYKKEVSAKSISWIKLLAIKRLKNKE